uniref:Immunoglobulin domain-containing protein n=1 Tax=Astyanax mexicanus TaxID=7994 RepID=A0A3B1ISA6_ASTMX
MLVCERRLKVLILVSLLLSLYGCRNLHEKFDPVFRVVGDSVRLEINGSASEFDDFFWVFNSTVNVQKYYKILKHNTQTPRYKDRVEFNEETCSLTLKNVQKDDSGLYEVKASSTEKTAVAKYRLSVFGKSYKTLQSIRHGRNSCTLLWSGLVPQIHWRLQFSLSLKAQTPASPSPCMYGTASSSVTIHVDTSVLIQVRTLIYL